jgi:putative DNA primase/helicase
MSAASSKSDRVIRLRDSATRPAVPAVEKADAVQPDLTSWRLKAYDFINQRLDKAATNGARLLKGTKPEALVDTLVQELRAACKTGDKLISPLPQLSQAELESELCSIAKAAVARFENTPTPGAPGGAEPALSNADRSPEGSAMDETQFVILGHSRGEYFFRHNKDPQVLSMGANGMTPAFLISLAPLQYWELRYVSKKGCDWNAAKSDVMARAHERGIFRPDKIRTRGAWLDKNRMVLNVGDRLVVDGREFQIHDFKDPVGVYEVGNTVELDLNVAPLTAAESRKVLDVAGQFPWASPLFGRLLAGWIVTAPFSGIISWRPHVWLTGPSGAGKTAILQRYVKPLTPFRYEKTFTGASSEAGIRQSLGHDSLPVLFEEAEAETRTGRSRLENILLLLRSASSSIGDQTAKGTTTGRPLDYVFRSAALLASIFVPIKNTADDSRVTRLELRKLDPEPWPKLLPELAAFTPEYGARFFRRILNLLPALLTNINTFQDAVSAHLKDGRAGQQYGTLIAGAYMIGNDDAITQSGATDYVSSMDWGDDGHGEPVDANLDEHRCLASILDAQVSVTISEKQGDFLHTHSDKRTIGDLIKKALIDEPRDFGVSREDADDVLRRYGIRSGLGTGRKVGDDETQAKAQYFWVANRNDALSKVIGEHGWSSNGWQQYLCRIAGAVKSGIEVKRFASSPTCWVALPSSLVLGE